jgi:2-phosphoglycerate kinase
MPKQGEPGKIMVEKRGKVEPFSRDVLARSLIGSGISEKEANFIAKKIEANLRQGYAMRKMR